MFRNEPRMAFEKQPEVSFEAYSLMEDLLEKLKLLNYDNEFINVLKVKPIHRYYFMVPKNPGEQFYIFSSLAAWLIRKAGKRFEQPQEYDDPNFTINNILDAVRETGIVVDFAPNKLKQGMGEHVIFVLDRLAEQALKTVHFKWGKPKPPQEKEEEIEQIEDESEINLDRVEEEMMAAYSDDSDEENNIFHIDDLSKTIKGHAQTTEIISNVDTDAWKLELERVLPQLKVTIKSDSRDWRSHVEQMKTYNTNIHKSLSSTKNHLDRLHKDITITLEKIANRERYLNRELEPVLDEYRTLQDQLSKVKDSYNELSGGVTERARNLAVLTDKLEMIKQQMDERGSSMTDGTPLVNIKKTIAKVKSEIVEMNVRIGVLQCMLLQSKINEKKLLEEDLNLLNVVF